MDRRSIDAQLAEQEIRGLVLCAYQRAAYWEFLGILSTSLLIMQRASQICCVFGGGHTANGTV